MSSSDTTTPVRPDLSVLKDNDPKAPGVLCLDGTYLRQLVAYIEHLEREAMPCFNCGGRNDTCRTTTKCCERCWHGTVTG